MRDETRQDDNARPCSNSADGIIVFYKPRGITSHDAVAFVRRLTGVRRVGHTGTLDPMAEGVLPVCVGKATRLIEFMDGGNDSRHGAEICAERGGILDTTSSRDPYSKAYDCEMRLGVTTDTLDVWGSLTSETDPEFACSGITPDRVREVFASLTGDVEQIPPAYSAIKYKGKKLYEYARAGKEIPEGAMRPRRVRIEKIEMSNMIFDSGNPGAETALHSADQMPSEPACPDLCGRGFATINFSVLCSKGTYVRSIVRDAGEALGCGAAMSALTRTKSGVFTLSDAHTKEALEHAAGEGNLRDMMLPVDAAAPFMPAVSLDEKAGGNFINGVKVRAMADQSDGTRHVRVYAGGRFAGIGEYSDGVIKPCKVIVI